MVVLVGILHHPTSVTESQVNTGSFFIVRLSFLLWRDSKRTKCLLCDTRTELDSPVPK